MLRRFACWLGIHSRVPTKIKIGPALIVDPDTYEVSYEKVAFFNYGICKHCGAGDPRISGEW